LSTAVGALKELVRQATYKDNVSNDTGNGTKLKYVQKHRNARN
jgi:hypothetical protein